MHLKRLELNGFKSFAHTSEFVFDVPIIAIVGPNGSGKSNVVEAIRFVLGEQSVKSMRGKTGSDLIFKGSKDISKMSRARVSITFDNKNRVFYINQGDTKEISVDFDEVTIGREVFSDGSSVYRINGTEVRMKDIHELIASINIGSSGHHIISQGEADRYLNANARDRRTLIEEALGLKVYQYRLKESLRKLKKAEENLRETELLRREIAPHIRFLKKQVEKIQRAKELRVILEEQYLDYLKREDFYIKHLQKTLQQQEEILLEEKREVDIYLASHQQQTVEQISEEKDLMDVERKLSGIRQQKQEYLREIGRLEGMISVLQKPKQTSVNKQFSYQRIVTFKEEIQGIINTLNRTDISSLTHFLSILSEKLDHLIGEHTEETIHEDTSLQEFLAKESLLRESLSDISLQEDGLIKEIVGIQEVISKKRIKQQEEQREFFIMQSRKKELDGKQELLHSKKQSLLHRIADRDLEYQEALVLLGLNQLEIQETDFNEVTTESQTQLRRELERNKIRLEDMGGGTGIETVKEYEETVQRDEFLSKEIDDVQTTITSLNQIINELKGTLNIEFNAGVEKINIQFNNFFTLMFGGGKAVLKEVIMKKKKSPEEEFDTSEDENQEEYGIDIAVELPRKKVSDLDMLSGGERSLTSIALLFALSQVNPPPFLVLDETDAALDEANSQKYGDMIESLSAYSQLILVTHNRETMSRAQTLFGVTLGRDDASTMLSLRLEDAEKYAK